ncbi:MAG: TlpA disulfide reductase family protein [Chloroherpetonaceae bacterium]|nr:TlpA family protein disulfide reductase [bacterium]
MKKILNIAIALGIFSSLLMNVACSQESKTQTTDKVLNKQSATALVYNVEQILPTDEGKAINFTFSDNGKSSSYEELTKGKVVLLNFWGTWCPPCRREIPDLIETYNDFKDQGVVVIGIAMERDEKQASKIVNDFAIKNKLNYVNFPSRAVAEAYGTKFSTISAVPTTYIIDRNGNVVEMLVGMRDKAAFSNAIKKYL